MQATNQPTTDRLGPSYNVALANGALTPVPVCLPCRRRNMLRGVGLPIQDGCDRSGDPFVVVQPFYRECVDLADRTLQVLFGQATSDDYAFLRLRGAASMLIAIGGERVAEQLIDLDTVARVIAAAIDLPEIVLSAPGPCPQVVRELTAARCWIAIRNHRGLFRWPVALSN